MKKLIVLAIIATLAAASTAFAASYGKPGDVHVDGYYRSNGTYVNEHYRTQPDGNQYNNYNSYSSPSYSSPVQKQQEPAWQDKFPNHQKNNDFGRKSLLNP